MKIPCGVIRGRVVEGNRIGRGLGYPTANVAVNDDVALANGVYAAIVEFCVGKDAANIGGLERRRYGAMANLGVRPTFSNDGRRVLELHLFDFRGDLYGCEVRVELLEFIRPEQKFDSPDALRAQIERDEREIKRRTVTKLKFSTDMNNEFDYYLIGRAGDQAYPLLITSPDSEHTEEYVYDNQKNEIVAPKEMEFVFGKPYPRKPVIGDYFSQTESIVSEKIKNILEPMKIKGIQLIPATVTSNKGDVYDGYYYIHLYNIIKAMDMNPEKSIYKQLSGGSYHIERFNLDKEVLGKIPLEERLIFRLDEDYTMKLYHKSVVDAVMAVNPTGVKFTKVEDYRF